MGRMKALVVAVDGAVFSFGAPAPLGLGGDAPPLVLQRQK